MTTTDAQALADIQAVLNAWNGPRRTWDTGDTEPADVETVSDADGTTWSTTCRYGDHAPGWCRTHDQDADCTTSTWDELLDRDALPLAEHRDPEEALDHITAIMRGHLTGILRGV